MNTARVRIAALALGLALSAGVTACGSDSETTSATPAGTKSSTAATHGTAPASATETGGSAPDDAITDKPGGSGGSGYGY